MKRTFATLALASATLLTGCHAPHHSSWEYRTYRTPVGGSEDGLNKLAAEGWTVQSFTTTPNDSSYWTFLLRRPKK